MQSWDLNVYGAAPKLTLDERVSHEGARSLRVEASEPSDTALGQEVKLRPNATFRLSGWLKTKALALESARVGGTLQVQRRGGQGILASGANHLGDTDWTKTEVFFRTPADGQVRICLFFAGFGKGTGTAWFDDIRLEPMDFASYPIVITREPAGKGTISPFQYGQFVEYLCNLVPAMWAERLHDGSFEGLSPYKFEFIKQTDFKEKPWHPSGQVNRAVYILDRAQKISGDVSQKIDVEAGAPCHVGISQEGVFVDRGEACDFNCWMKAGGLAGPVTVSLHRGLAVYAACVFEPASEWKKFSARLVSKGRDESATLTLEFRGPGTLWLDNASLMPTNTVGGWRPDVVQALRELRPGIIRLGGSVVDEPSMGDYEWKDTVGDPDRRRPFRAWGGLQPTGPGLEEFLRLCREVEAEPLICTRFTGRTPRDAADEVEYLNGSADTPMGAWRARNGHAAPYGVKYWQVGNERSGTNYEAQVAAFCEAMKKADPSIRLLSSFPTREVLRRARPWLDYAAPHHYSQDLAWMENDLVETERMVRDCAPGRNIKLAVTEWNTTAGDAGPRRAMLWSLANALACSRYHNLLHRHCDQVEIANRSNLANSFCSGIIQTDNHRLFKTPTYYAQQLYATLAGTRPLDLQSGIPGNVDIDLSATLSADGKEVTLFVVNDSLEAATRHLDASAFGSGPREIHLWTLGDSERAGEPDAANSFEKPERIKPVSSRFLASFPRFDYQFPPLTLIVMNWPVR